MHTTYNPTPGVLHQAFLDLSQQQPKTFDNGMRCCKPPGCGQPQQLRGIAGVRERRVAVDGRRAYLRCKREAVTDSSRKNWKSSEGFPFSCHAELSSESVHLLSCNYEGSAPASWKTKGGLKNPSLPGTAKDGSYNSQTNYGCLDLAFMTRLAIRTEAQLLIFLLARYRGRAACANLVLVHAEEVSCALAAIKDRWYCGWTKSCTT